MIKKKCKLDADAGKLLLRLSFRHGRIPGCLATRRRLNALLFAIMAGTYASVIIAGAIRVRPEF
jgi:hypothetical protein